MLYRDKKEIDYNKGKWITVGGHIENGETPDEAMIREVYEETGFNVVSYKRLGVVHFSGDFKEDMYVYISHDFNGTFHECDEGTLKWFKKEDIYKLNMWEGDFKFIDYVFEEKAFEISLVYNNNILV